MSLTDRLLGPRIGPAEMGWFSRAWRIRFIGVLLEPWRTRKYARLTKGTRWELNEDGSAKWSQTTGDMR